MDKYIEARKNNTSSCEEICGKVLKINSNQTFNESNLMTIPWVSLKRKRLGVLDRTWIRNGDKVGLKVVGSAEHGCPTIYELDVLMGLFKIHSENMKSLMVMDERKVINMPQKINFTYRRLAKAMGLKNFGKTTKERLEKSIKCMTEATIYSNLSIRNHEKGEYIINIKEERSCRILKDLTSYSVESRIKKGENRIAPSEIQDFQSVKIDEFFYNNLCSGYFKLFNYDRYKTLRFSVSKKLLLILSQWSHTNGKFLTKQILYDYIGLATPISKNQEYSHNKEIKKAAQELADIGFIKSYDWGEEGVKFNFKESHAIDIFKNKLLEKYRKQEEVIVKLRELGVTWDDITRYCRIDTVEYISALLRYIDYQNEHGNIKDLNKYVYRGLPYNSYDVSEFIVVSK